MLTLSYGRPPWIALILAFSFGFYGLVRKQAGVQAVPALTVETGFQAPFALIYFGVLAATGTMTFGDSPGNSVMLMTAGIATTIPLLLFGAAAIRLPLVVLGLLQYLAPVLQFIIGITVFGEHMPWNAGWVSCSCGSRCRCSPSTSSATPDVRSPNRRSEPDPRPPNRRWSLRTGVGEAHRGWSCAAVLCPTPVPLSNARA